MTEAERKHKIQACLNSIQAHREEIRQKQTLKQLGYRGLT